MIDIKNWSDNDVLHHSLVLLKGGVENVEHGEIFISVNDGNRISWPVICYSFRALVELRKGENKLFLQCGMWAKELRLNYKSDNRHYFVRLVYIVCRNSSGSFQSPAYEDNSVQSAQLRLSFGAKLIQSITAEKVGDYAPFHRTFSLEEDHNGQVVCHVFHSKLTIEETHTKNEEALWDHFAMELMSSDLKTDRCKFLAFLSSTRYITVQPSEKLPVGHAQVRARTRGHVVLGGGGLALIGTGCLYTWPSRLDEFQTRMEDVRPVDLTHFMDDSCNRSQLWACFVSSLGASLHELAHTFDIGHSQKGIMGLGFHQLQQELQVNDQKKCCICSRNAHFDEKLTHSHLYPPDKSAVSGLAVKRNFIQWSTPCVHCPDGPFWTPSAAGILFYNKWFLPETTKEDSTLLTCGTTPKGWVVSSVHGLAVAEMRDSTGLVLAYWNVRKQQTAPTTVCFPKGHLSWHARLLLVQDVRGNMLKTDLSTRLQKSFCPKN